MLLLVWQHDFRMGEQLFLGPSSSWHSPIPPLPVPASLATNWTPSLWSCEPPAPPYLSTPAFPSPYTKTKKGWGWTGEREKIPWSWGTFSQAKSWLRQKPKLRSWQNISKPCVAWPGSPWGPGQRGLKPLAKVTWLSTLNYLRAWNLNEVGCWASGVTFWAWRGRAMGTL